MRLKHWRSRACKGIVLLILQVAFDSTTGQTFAKENHSLTTSSSSTFTNNQLLSIGGALPDIPVEKIINYAISKTNTASFKDKLPGLDLMRTTCSGCIARLPLLRFK